MHSLPNRLEPMHATGPVFTVGQFVGCIFYLWAPTCVVSHQPNSTSATE